MIASRRWLFLLGLFLYPGVSTWGCSGIFVDPNEIIRHAQDQEMANQPLSHKEFLIRESLIETLRVAIHTEYPLSQSASSRIRKLIDAAPAASNPESIDVFRTILEEAFRQTDASTLIPALIRSHWRYRWVRSSIRSRPTWSHWRILIPKALPNRAEDREQLHQDIDRLFDQIRSRPNPWRIRGGWIFKKIIAPLVLAELLVYGVESYTDHELNREFQISIMEQMNHHDLIAQVNQGNLSLEEAWIKSQERQAQKLKPKTKDPIQLRNEIHNQEIHWEMDQVLLQIQELIGLRDESSLIKMEELRSQLQDLRSKLR